MLMINDFQYACRLLAKKPGFTALTVLVMAVGIGMSVYMFSFINVMVFKALPFKHGESLIVISSSQDGMRNGGKINLLDYYEIKNSLEGATEISSYTSTSVNVSELDGSRRYSAMISEPNIFNLLRTNPILGQVFTASEAQYGSEPVAIIGYDVWKNQFGGSENVLNNTIRINGNDHSIAAVMPKGFSFPGSAEIWLPLKKPKNELSRLNAVNVYGFARLDRGVTTADINRQLKLIMQRIEEKYPKTNSGISAYSENPRMSATGVGDAIVVIYSMQIIAVLILILASINVGNLLLSRAIERSKETAIRVALGAPRSRLIGQMLWESSIICTTGGLVGLLVMTWGFEVTEKTIAAFSLGKQLYWLKFGLDGFTIKLLIAFVLLTIFLTGFLPAWKNSGGDFNAVLRDGTRGSVGKKTSRLNKFLIVSEIFISMTVLISAGVMLVNNYIKTHIDNGADIANTLTASILLPKSSYDTDTKKSVLLNTIQTRLESTSNTLGDVMITSALPGVWAYQPTIAIEGEEYTGDNTYPRANYVVVTPGTLQKLGIELIQGRYFNTGDNKFNQTSVIVTDSFVARYFTKQSPLGKRIRIVELDGDETKWLTIVGVVEHTIQDGEQYMPVIFQPYAQAPSDKMTIAMRMVTDVPETIRYLRTTLASIDPDLPAYRVETYQNKITRLNGPTRFGTTIFLLFGFAAIVLAASGIYGVMSNAISQSTQEIGVKRALGAWDSMLIREFLMKGLKQLLWGGIPGLIFGVTLGFAMARLSGIDNLGLFLITVVITLIIGSVVILAIYFPAKRALKMEPSQALQYE